MLQVALTVTHIFLSNHICALRGVQDDLKRLLHWKQQLRDGERTKTRQRAYLLVLLVLSFCAGTDFNIGHRPHRCCMLSFCPFRCPR